MRTPSTRHATPARPFRVAASVLVTAALAASLSGPADAASRVGATATDASGDVKVLAGSPTARQKTMTDLGFVGVGWYRPTPYQYGLDVSFEHKHRKGSGPHTYPFRADIAVDYTTRDGSTHRADLAVDPSDTTAGPWGRFDMAGPHVADAEAAGWECGPAYAAGVNGGLSVDASVLVDVACLGDLATVTGVRVTLTTRDGESKASDTAVLKSLSAAPPSTATWRKRGAKDEAGDAAYSTRRLEKFADIVHLKASYVAAKDRVRLDVKLAALSTTVRQPRQQLTFYVEDRPSWRTATAFVPRSAGKAGSFTLERCDGEKMSLNRTTRTVTLSFPASCVGADTFEADVWTKTLVKGQADSTDAAYTQGITLF